MNLGVNILFLIKISLDKILFIAKKDEITPECVYFIFNFSKID